MTSPMELFGIDTLIDPDDRDMVDAVRTLLAAEVRPHLQSWYEDGSPRATSEGSSTDFGTALRGSAWYGVWR